MEFDYIKIITWVVLIAVIAIAGKRIWELITKKTKKQEKWQDFMED